MDGLDHGSNGQGCDWNNGARVFGFRQKGKNDGHFNA